MGLRVVHLVQWVMTPPSAGTQIDRMAHGHDQLGHFQGPAQMSSPPWMGLRRFWAGVYGQSPAWLFWCCTHGHLNAPPLLFWVDTLPTSTYTTPSNLNWAIIWLHNAAFLYSTGLKGRDSRLLSPTPRRDSHPRSCCWSTVWQFRFLTGSYEQSCVWYWCSCLFTFSFPCVGANATSSVSNNNRLLSLWSKQGAA